MRGCRTLRPQAFFQRMLTVTLHVMQRDGFTHRQVLGTSLQSVEYSLPPPGRSLAVLPIAINRPTIGAISCAGSIGGLAGLGRPRLGISVQHAELELRHPRLPARRGQGAGHSATRWRTVFSLILNVSSTGAMSITAPSSDSLPIA